MTYCNFDSRVKGNLTIPSDRLQKLRDLEKKVKLARGRKRNKKTKGS